MIRFASIGSGSKGNALLIECQDDTAITRILWDCGFSLRHLNKRFDALGVALDGIDAIIISHEHRDHILGAQALSRRFNIPIWVTPGTRIGWSFSSQDIVHEFDPHSPFSIGLLEFTPIPIPHDAREPVQFKLTDGNKTFTHLTDLGFVTPHIEEIASNSDALMIECNHDLECLKNGPYPRRLKRRIAGNYGHLSNDAAAEFAAKCNQDKLRVIVGAHLSEENNRPELACAAMAEKLNASSDCLVVANQWEGTDWLMV